jgi:hypothetical protein
MGYDYGFHLVLVKPPKEVALATVAFLEGSQEGSCPVETYAKEVAAFCKDYGHQQDSVQGFAESCGFWFPAIGKICHGGSGSYSCGDNDDGLIKMMALIGKRFPEAVFALHHYYWDMIHLTVYTFQGDKILEETFTDLGHFKVGAYTFCMPVDFMKIAIDGCMSMFFSKKYGYDFDFNYEKIYEYAGVGSLAERTKASQQPLFIPNNSVTQIKTSPFQPTFTGSREDHDAFVARLGVKVETTIELK